MSASSHTLFLLQFIIEPLLCKGTKHCYAARVVLITAYANGPGGAGKPDPCAEYLLEAYTQRTPTVWLGRHTPSPIYSDLQMPHGRTLMLEWFVMARTRGTQAPLPVVLVRDSRCTCMPDTHQYKALFAGIAERGPFRQSQHIRRTPSLLSCYKRETHPVIIFAVVINRQPAQRTTEHSLRLCHAFRT